MKNRWNAVPRLWLHATLAWLVAACGGGINNPPAEEEVPVIDRDTCEDNSLLAGCSDTPSPDPSTDVDNSPDEQEDLDPSESELELARAAAENVLRTNCGQCHGPQLSQAASRAGMNYIDNIDELVNQGKIVPLDSENSPVVRRMTEGSMPPLGTDGPRPSANDIDLVAEFVDNPLFWPEYRPAASCDGQLITFDELYAAVNDDLSEQDADDRRFMRYVTLTNRYNAGLCADSLDRERFALTKVLNMLSTRPAISVPTAIDDDDLIYRIDMRDYDWDREINAGGNQFRDGWEAIIAASPYAVPFVGNDADDLRDDTETDVPIMNGDALLDAAAVGDVYYGLIDVDVGDSLDNFIANDLGVDVQDNLEDGDVVRAGTTRSAISREDRVVERHELGVRRGVLWQGFDSDPDGGTASIFSDPFGGNEGGTDVIFSLPNGLLAFVIADDNRTIVTESNLLLDTFQDDFVARTAVSCSNCHAQGFNMVTDEVRPFVEDNRFRIERDDFEAVTEIYLEPAEFEEIIAEDSRSFQVSLEQAGLPTTGSDPVAGTYLRFNLDVDLATVAGDLGVTQDELDEYLNLLDPRLAPVREVTVDRDDFTESYEESLCILQVISENHPDPDRCAQIVDN